MRLLLIIPATYLVVCVLLYIFQNRLIYFPSRHIHMTPADVGMPFESLMLSASDGVRINAWYVPCSSPRGTVLLFHGNAGNLGDVILDVAQWHRLGFNVLAVDYRGFGESEGAPTEKGIYADADAAWLYGVHDRGEDPRRIVVVGRSLGGAVAIELAHRRAPGALIVESTFTSLPDVGSLHYPLLPVRLLARCRYDSRSRVRSIQCPKLFAHGSEDTLIPIRLGRKLFDSAAEPKTFLETAGDHTSSGIFYDRASAAELSRFLGAAIGEASPRTE